MLFISCGAGNLLSYFFICICIIRIKIHLTSIIFFFLKTVCMIIYYTICVCWAGSYHSCGVHRFLFNNSIFFTTATLILFIHSSLHYIIFHCSCMLLCRLLNKSLNQKLHPMASYDENETSMMIRCPFVYPFTCMSSPLRPNS